MDTVIRECSLEQVELWQCICKETFKDTFAQFNTSDDMETYLNTAYTLEKLTQSLLNDYTWVYFIYYRDQIAGYLKLNSNQAQSEPMGDDYLEVECIYIRQAFKRQGLGQLLLQKAYDMAQALHKTKIWLGVWEHNPAAIAFYKKQGFVQKESHSFWVGQDEQTDYIMEKVCCDDIR